MAKTIEQLLKEIDFSPKEQAVYLAVLELGEAAVSPIAKQAGVNRGTTYDILRYLIKKGLVAKLEKQRKLHYSATGVEGLHNYLEDQKDNWLARLDSFKQLKPEILALLGSAGAKPTVRFFEGKLGIKEVFMDPIRSGTKELLCYSSAERLEEAVGSEYLSIYTKQKARAGVFTRVIAPNKRASEEYLAKYYKEKASEQFRLKTVPPEKFPLNAETDIYGDKVAMISLNPKELVAVIIESPVLARNQRIIFNLLWKLL